MQQSQQLLPNHVANLQLAMKADKLPGLSTVTGSANQMTDNSQWNDYQVPSSQAGNGYDSISNTTRKALVQLVSEQNLSVRKASKILQIKYTTAKALVQKFRNTGNIDRQRARRMTFEDDQREKFRKDLIKALPIDVEEDSEDERWGFNTGPSNLSNNPQLNSQLFLMSQSQNQQNFNQHLNIGGGLNHQQLMALGHTTFGTAPQLDSIINRTPYGYIQKLNPQASVAPYSQPQQNFKPFNAQSQIQDQSQLYMFPEQCQSTIVPQPYNQFGYASQPAVLAIKPQVPILPPQSKTPKPLYV